MTASTSSPAAELASVLRPALLRLTRQVRQQRVDTSVTLTQLSAMFTLNVRGPMSAGDLAACEKVQPPSMTKVIANLDERGLVQRDPHPTDGRQVIISITPAGQALLDSEKEQRDAWLARQLASLSADERAQLERVIPILDKLAQT